MKIKPLTQIPASISRHPLPRVFWAPSWQSGAEVCCSRAPSGPPGLFLPCPLRLSPRCLPLSVDVHAALLQSWKGQKWIQPQECSALLTAKTAECRREVRSGQKPHRMLQHPALFFPFLMWIPVNCNSRRMLWEDRGSGNLRVEPISSLGEEPVSKIVCCWY